MTETTRFVGTRAVRIGKLPIARLVELAELLDAADQGQGLLATVTLAGKIVALAARAADPALTPDDEPFPEGIGFDELVALSDAILTAAGFSRAGEAVPVAGSATSLAPSSAPLPPAAATGRPSSTG